jgi:hypothetical protein
MTQQNGEDLARVYGLIRPYMGVTETVVVVLETDGVVERTWRHELGADNSNLKDHLTDYNMVDYMDYGRDYNTSLFQFVRDTQPNVTQTVSVYQANLIPAATYEQFFRDGETHCVMQPTLEWAQELLAKQTNPRCARRYKAIVANCQKYDIQCDGGLPASEMQAVCDELHIGIQILSL